MDKLTVDEIFDLLGHRHRRHALTTLLACDGGTTVTELAEKTSRRFDIPSERIEAGLYHAHLPRLEGMGVVEYDSDGGIVELTEAVRDLEPFIELAEE